MPKYMVKNSILYNFNFLSSLGLTRTLKTMTTTQVNDKTINGLLIAVKTRPLLLCHTSLMVLRSLKILLIKLLSTTLSWVGYDHAYYDRLQPIIS